VSLDRQDIEVRIRQLQARLAAAGVTHVAIFGSRARGDHRPDSDLDLLIEVEDGRGFSLVDLVGVQHIIGDDLGIQVNATMRRSLQPRFRNEITPDIREIF
jgi:predicted nucleotidyltransferase